MQMTMLGKSYDFKLINGTLHYREGKLDTFTPVPNLPRYQKIRQMALDRLRREPRQIPFTSHVVLEARV